MQSCVAAGVSNSVCTQDCDAEYEDHAQTCTNEVYEAGGSSTRDLELTATITLRLQSEDIASASFQQALPSAIGSDVAFGASTVTSPAVPPAPSSATTGFGLPPSAPPGGGVLPSAPPGVGVVLPSAPPGVGVVLPSAPPGVGVVLPSAPPPPAAVVIMGMPPATPPFPPGGIGRRLQGCSSGTSDLVIVVSPDANTQCSAGSRCSRLPLPSVVLAAAENLAESGCGAQLVVSEAGLNSISVVVATDAALASHL